MEQNNENPFLARWLANELSDEELKTFEKTEEYKQYQEIIETIDTASFPEYNVDSNFEATLQKIKTQTSTTSGSHKNRTLYNLVYAVAASVVLFFGYTFFFQTEQITTQFAETKNFELPDGSVVNLNAGSELSFKSFNWKKNRTLSLEGEAFFKVKKGETFTVQTKEGTVKVLGTQFKVNSRKNLYEVTCFEGKVQVVVAIDTLILMAGDALIFQEDELKTFQVKERQPDWILKESSFNEVHILEVIEELERQFAIQIEGKENLKSAYFSGRFKHGNLSNALETVFTTMEIPYTLDKKGILTIKKY